jgi:flagellar biogenesis protein FliO
MSRIVMTYLVLALLFALSLVWLLMRFLSCCCSPIDADFCQLGIGF